VGVDSTVGVTAKTATLRRRSIRGKLTLLVLASVGAAVTLVTGVLAWRDGDRETHAAFDRFSSIAKVTAAMSEEAAATADRQRAFAALRAIATIPEITYARIERPDGALIAETGSGARLANDIAGDAGDHASVAALVGSHTAEVRAPITYGGRLVGRVVMLGKLDDGGVRLVSSLLLSLAAGLGAALAGLAVAARLQRRIAGPVVALTEAMAQVRESHDYARSADVAADDEVGDLVAGFNDMLAEIRTRDGALAAHAAGLERTVAIRTADLKVAKDAAEAASVAKSDFLATMSHEIRTPMNGVMVMAEMLAAGDLPPKQRRFAEVIAKSGASLLAIINDILDFSKIEAGKLELESVPADPAEVVEDCLALFWERARGKGLDLAAHIDPATPALIETDPTRLRQVIGNLVNNAIKFTEAGAVMVQAAPMQTPRGDILRIAIRDTGIGIPKDKIPGLFEAFTQADQSTTRRFGGTGLGLAICRRLAEAMGGRLTADSEVGKGSVFALDLPLKALAPAPVWPQLGDETAAVSVAAPATRAALQRYLRSAGMKLVEPDPDKAPPALRIAEPAALRGEPRGRAPVICIGEYGETQAHALQGAGLADLVLVQPLRRRELAAALAQLAAGAPISEALDAAARPESESLPSFTGRRILVADDSAVNREVALEALSRLGCLVTLAADGREALEAVGEERFDLVLMDASMPHMDGYEAAAEIRRREADARRRTPIVALTAHVVGSAADRWREAGMDGMLSKPFTLAALAAKLAEFVAPAAPQPAAAPPKAAAVALPVSPQPKTAAPLTATLGPGALSDLLDPLVTGELARMAASGKSDFVTRVRRLYRENAPEAVKALIAACTEGDYDAAAKAAHALKSMSLNMGARVVAESAARMETQARELMVVNVDQAQAVHRQLLATLDVLEGYPPDLRPVVTDGAAPDEEALLADLADAIDRDQLTLVYQPQYDREGQTITGIETLVRWTHPKRGFVSPAFFIPIAERYGMIGRVTHWVLNRAMRETRDLGDFTISFNASAVEFADPSFVDELSVLIARCGFDPHRLEIEVTETAVLAEEDEVRRNMARLHELGLKIALDDFGVGYSSLSHLRLFPFDKLKIDRAFVTGCAENVQSATLVHAVVSIGRALGMKVVAEGVETEAQRKFLKVAGVHAMQGYLFAKPEPVEALKIRLAAMREPAALSA
jgi:EAL domain-containing protein (putative c-di-GMP-specific phosphodiesterase class I)/signal transduction histidine kinase/CheY-like chemotaxis protein